MPSISANVITTCRVDPVLPRSLEVIGHGSAEFQHGEQLQIAVGGGVTDWQVVVAGRKMWLVGTSRFTFNRTDGHFALVRGSDGRLSLEAIREEVRGAARR
jgi:hypothetical protein